MAIAIDLPQKVYFIPKQCRLNIRGRLLKLGCYSQSDAATQQFTLYVSFELALIAFYFAMP